MKAPQGQNFLFQPGWQRRVADAVGDSEDLVEIGGGPGHLTALLAARTRRLRVVESDPALAAALRQRFAGTPVEVVEADVLRVDLTALAAGRPLRVAGNLPYYITSPILLHLFRHASVLTDAVLMVQREVAQRMLAAPGGREFGLLSATTQLYARGVRLFDLPPGAFRPAPRVYSTLLRLEFAPRAEELGVDLAGFLRFLRRAFAGKRKQLGPRLGVSLAAVGLPPAARAEQLGLDQLALLYRSLLLE